MPMPSTKTRPIFGGFALHEFLLFENALTSNDAQRGCHDVFRGHGTLIKQKFVQKSRGTAKKRPRFCWWHWHSKENASLHIWASRRCAPRRSDVETDTIPSDTWMKNVIRFHAYLPNSVEKDKVWHDCFKEITRLGYSSVYDTNFLFCHPLQTVVVFTRWL